VTFYGGNLAAPLTAKITPAPRAFDTVAVPGSASLPFVFATSDLPEFAEPVTAVAIPSVINARLMEAGEVDRYKLNVQPGDKLLFELQARELGTSRIEGVITVYDAAGKKLDSAGDTPLPEDVFAVQGTSRTSSDPFLKFSVPEGVREITVAVEDLAQRGGPAYGYRLIAQRAAEDFTLSLNTAHVNIPAGGSAFVSVTANRRGYDGPIQLSIPDLPKGIVAEGGLIPREHVDPNNTRSFNRRGVLILTAEAGVELAARDLKVLGEAKLADGSTLRRQARGPAMSIEVAGATAQGVVDRQRPLTAAWLDFQLPAALAPPPAATLTVKQTKVTRMAEGDKFEFEYEWQFKAQGARPRGNLKVEIIGARDIRVTNMQRKPGMEYGTAAGTIEINTSKATDAGPYDMIVRGTVDAGMAQEEIYARPVAFVVAEWSKTVDVSSAR
jgi:hypothetical protein